MYDTLRARFSMQTFRRLIILVSLCAIGILIWKLNVRVVFRTVSNVGLGILFIIALQSVALLLNSVGWKLSFTQATGRSYGLFELSRLWLAMDGVNYFVPTGTIAGEVARASMLKDCHPVEVRTASVVISRIAQTIAQIMFVLAGLALLLSQVHGAREIGWITTAGAWLLGVIAVLALIYFLVGPRNVASRCGRMFRGTSGWVREMFRQVRAYFAAHPWRFVASIAVFGAGYAWLAVEAYWICRFIGVPVSALLALTIEMLSVAVDGALFLIPAKIGTQELGKTAIFSLLALPLSAGLAFGIIRHIREVVWALAGFGVYSAEHARCSLRYAQPIRLTSSLKRGS